MSETLTGYARCSTDAQDLLAQRDRPHELGVAEERIYLDHGLTGTNRKRPGLDQALAAIRADDTLVVPKLDRLARSVPDARAIGDALADHGIKLSLGGQVYDPADPTRSPAGGPDRAPRRLVIVVTFGGKRRGNLRCYLAGPPDGRPPGVGRRQACHITPMTWAGFIDDPGARTGVWRAG